MFKRSIDCILLSSGDGIKKAIKSIDEGAMGIALVVDDNKHLLGTITDGDIRRQILKGYDESIKVSDIMNKHPKFIREGMTRKQIEEIFLKSTVAQIPVIDNNGRVKDIVLLSEFLEKTGKENYVFIMAGGRGTRLYPLTQEIPKPMLKVGDKPLLETIINNLSQHGYTNILISVNYKRDIIENYFQDGTNFGVNIRYIREDKPLGTCGSIRLAREYLNKPFILLNGDLLSNVNFNYFLEYHKENNNSITLATTQYEMNVPYGVINTDGNNVIGIKEKPTYNFSINAGIYCVNPELIDFIPDGTAFNITELLSICIEKGIKVGSFPMREYWLDIGRMDEYHKANEDIRILEGGI